jgi:BASS family bile acid:Na+ symporter
MEGQRNRLQLLGSFVHKHFLLLLLSAYGCAALWPSLGIAAKDIQFARFEVLHEPVDLSLPMSLLAGLLLNAGLCAKVSELMRIVRKPHVPFAGLVVNLLAPVGLLAVLAEGMRFWHNPAETQELLVGLALVAAMPIAGSSTAWSHHADGNLALSLGLVLFSTVLSPLTTPLVFTAFESMATGDHAEALRSLSGGQTGAFLVLCVVIPSLAGLTLQKMVSETTIASLKPKLKLINTLLLVFLCYMNASAVLPQVVAYPDWDFMALIMAAVVVLCLASFGAGWLLARVLNVDQSQQRSLMFGLGLNNNGTGMVLASTCLAASPSAILPVLAYNLVQHLVAGGVSWSLAHPGLFRATRDPPKLEHHVDIRI